MFTFLMFIFFLLYKYMYFFEWEFLFMNSFSMEMTFFFDWMSIMFLSTVFFISSLVFMYSMEYMKKKINQFALLIFLFVMSMMLFILSPNLISILLGWDGLGLISYILIIFFQSKKSKNSGMLTLLLNRIGDTMIILSSWFFLSIGGMNFLFFESFYMKLGMNMIIIASMTKSAQMPFSSWLPAAMAAPTPVSSLVHSSTLVTAGIYLMLRFNMYMYMSELFMKFIFFLSTMTMLISGLTANFENDFKKIIALSTLSQLGLMMMTLSLGMTTFSFFHLSTHALFKALLFLCAGIMIHNMKNNQDIRLMGHMMFYMPLTMLCFVTANMSLCGFPFLSGFYSKDMIIEYIMTNKINYYFFMIMLISTSMTTSYTLRLLYYLSFFNKNYFNLMIKEEKLIFNNVIMLLSTFSMLSGAILSWLLYKLMFNFFLNINMKMIIFIIMLTGLMMSYFMKKKMNFLLFSLIFINYTISSMKKIPYINMKKMYNATDMGFFEYFGLQGMIIFMKKLFKKKMYMLTSFKMIIFAGMTTMLWLMYL
uniref:NADH-ubiquinone oxidoreductase chain 5 n=1 Tax=Elaphrothrips spiniceps TaxID=3003602 RepID=A0AA50LTN4_9NEOP|nr:NADH dehydrogenase subunit 5 [Elaphrothrips spiniceps]